MDVHIRWAIARDMQELLYIEDKSFGHLWREEDFIRYLKQRNCIAMVAENTKGTDIRGYMVYELHKHRLQLLNLAVHPKFRRKQVGTQLMERLISKLSTQRRRYIALEVRETNLAAQHFFHSVGFRAISVLRNFYEDCEEDAYLMQYLLQDQQEVEDSDVINKVRGK